jgi:hypothetical protein
MAHRLFKLLVLAALASASCAPADPLAGLSPEDKVFLFADTGTNVPFLGQPLDNGPLNCYPQRMNQGYALIDTDKALWLESIRPSGVEKHDILSVVPDADGFIVKARNGVGVTFDLLIERKGKDQAIISWDGAPPHLYKRCPLAGG